MKIIPISILSLVLILFSACIPITSNVILEPDSKLEVHFCPEAKCKEYLLAEIDKATDIKCAFYDLNLKDVMAKLKEKNAEVVVEDSTEIKGYRTFPSDDLMHNKFCVFDGKRVFTGSMNPTENDNFYNNNNIVIMESETIALNYLDEFDELYNGVNGKGDKVKSSRVMIGDVLVENYFCPEDNCKLRVINALKAANSSVYFMIFTFSDEDIGNLVYNKDYLGLDVKGVMEKRQAGPFSVYQTVKEFTRLDKNGHTMHHKVFIIDNSTVVTGSYNPTDRGNEGNDENVLIIHDREIAEKFVDEFLKVYSYAGDGEEMIDTESESGIKENKLIFTKIDYNPKGSDKGNEYLELKNTGTEEINLDYYSITDNRSNMRLSGAVAGNETIVIFPKFSLRNKDGMLFLKNNDDVVDYVYWEGIWNLKVSEGECLNRINFEVIEKSWDIVQC